MAKTPTAPGRSSESNKRRAASVGLVSTFVDEIYFPTIARIKERFERDEADAGALARRLDRLESQVAALEGRRPKE